MSAIEHLLPWTQQPQEAATPASGAPFPTPFLLFNAAQERELISGRAPSVRNTVITPAGYAYNTAGGATGWTASDMGQPGGVDELCMVTWGRNTTPFNVTSETRLAAFGYSATGLMVAPYNAGAVAAAVYHFPDYNGYIGATGPILSANAPHAIGMRYIRNSALQLWVDGAVAATVAAPNKAAGLRSASNGRFDLSVGTEERAFQQAGAAVWLQDIGEAGMAAITRHPDAPWQLFEPRRIWVPVSAGGGTTINAGVGESTAAGSTADISLGTTVNTGVGSAVADGSAASVSRGATVNASIGAAVAAGLDADISTSAGEYQVGNAVADGATASISLGTTVSADVSNAVAAGSTADVSLGTTVAAGVGNAVADGLSATITAGQTVSATVGDAVADGKTATITNDPVSTGIDLSFYGWDIFPEKLPEEKDSVRKYILDAVRDLSSKPIQKEVAKRATARILPPPVFVPRNLMVREIRLAVAEIVEAANEERRRKVRKYNETIMLWM